MPLLSHDILNGGESELYVWRVTESIDFFCKELISNDIHELSRFKSEKRKLERTAWRYIIRKFVTKDTIYYDGVGAPIFENDERYLSVSHSADMVAVMVSSDICGIDIESLDRNFSRVELRYISQKERELVPLDDEYFRAIFWSSKESVYKYCHTSDLDFIKDISIVRYCTKSRCLTAICRGVVVCLEYKILDNFVITITKLSSK